jgi:2-succinyl-6-hydroxy-2,4-cyclohexadiene-1-carboxylate synthase
MSSAAPRATRSAPCEIRSIEVEPGLALSVEIEGAGPPLLLLHGFTGTGCGLAEFSAPLATRYRCVRVDLVGHGTSAAPREVAPYTMERCTSQLAALLDALALPRAHVFGYSMGGRTALALACAYPQRVASLALVGASAGIEDPAARAARVRDDEALADRIEREGLAPFVDYWMGLPLFASQARLGAEFLARAREERLAQRAHGLANSLRGMGSGAQPWLGEALRGLAQPALLLVGELDAKFRAIAADLAARLAHASAQVIAGAGHAAHLEAPAACRAALLAHLDACGETSPRVSSSPNPEVVVSP